MKQNSIQFFRLFFTQTLAPRLSSVKRYFFNQRSFLTFRKTVIFQYKQNRILFHFFVYIFLRSLPKDYLLLFFLSMIILQIFVTGRNVGIDIRTFRRRSTGRVQSVWRDNGEDRFYVAAGRKFGTVASAGTRETRVVSHRAKSERYPRDHDELRRVSNSEEKKRKKLVIRFYLRQIRFSWKLLKKKINTVERETSCS